MWSLEYISFFDSYFCQKSVFMLNNTNQTTCYLLDAFTIDNLMQKLESNLLHRDFMVLPCLKYVIFMFCIISWHEKIYFSWNIGRATQCTESKWHLEQTIEDTSLYYLPTIGLCMMYYKIFWLMWFIHIPFHTSLIHSYLV